MDSKYLDWVENAAVENFKMQHHTADILAKEAGLTLAMLIAALGGSTAYAVRAVTGSTPSAIEFGAVGLTITLVLLSVLLVWRCLMIRPIPAIFNEPKNLLGEQLERYSFDEIRKFQLENMQDGIQEAGERNRRVAVNLSFVRMAAVISPIWFLVAFGYHWWGAAQTVAGAG